MVDRTFRIVGVTEPDITRERFASELLSWNSPALSEADASYDVLTKYPVSIKGIMAFAMHDSGLSTAGINVDYDTKNPGNTRSCQIRGIKTELDKNTRLATYSKNGVVIGRQINTRKGVFVKYESYVHGWEDMAARLTRPDFDYGRAGAETIEEIVPIYAPPYDQGNQPESYIADVVRKIGQLNMGPDRYTSIDGIPVVWIPSPPSNHGGRRDRFDVIVHHDIEGSAASGIATLTDPNREASCHFIPDPQNRRIVQMVGMYTVAWTSGNNKGNDYGINIENPGFAGRPFDPLVIDYTARITGVIAKDFNIPLVRLNREQTNAPGVKGVTGHGDFDQRGPRSNWHWDPGPTFPWDEVLTKARNVAGGTGTGGPGDGVTPPGPWFRDTGYGVSGGILADWESRGGVSTFGYPRSREFDTFEDGKPVRVQWFQRGRAEWWGPDTAVTWRLLGDDVLFAPIEHLIGYRFHMHDVNFRWAFTPQTEDEWNRHGHNMPDHMKLL